MNSTELLKGTLTTIILKLLADHGKMYGYEITQKVKEMTDEKILIKEGSLYPALHKLLRDGLVEVEQFASARKPLDAGSVCCPATETSCQATENPCCCCCSANAAG
ncbi:MAG: helix-turn-helix transcriptional regulator, partial [Bacteroidota bacterium]